MKNKKVTIISICFLLIMIFVVLVPLVVSANSSRGLNSYNDVNLECEAIPLFESEIISQEEALERGYTIVSWSELLGYDYEGNPISTPNWAFDNTFSLTNTQWTRIPGAGGNTTPNPVTFFILNDNFNPGNLAVEVQCPSSFRFYARNTNIPRGFGINATIPGSPGPTQNPMYIINLRATSVSGTYRVVSFRN